MSKHKVLFISHSFPPQGGPESFVNGKLGIAFHRAGWHIDVISHNSCNNNDSSTLWDQTQIFTRFSSKDISWIGFKLNILIWLIQTYRIGIKLHRYHNYAVILSRSQPIWGHVAGFLISLRCGTKWIANWNDPCPILRYPPPYGAGAEAPMSPLSSFIFNSICKMASWHTFPCERLKNYMISYMPAETQKKSSVIPHIFLENNENNLESPQTSSDPKSFHICHSGSTFYRNWKQFLYALRVFIDEVQAMETRVEFLGWQPQDFHSVANALDLLSFVKIRPAVTYEKSLSLLRRADVLLIIEADCAEGIFLPSKITDYVKAQRPVLAISPPTGTLADMIEQYGCGLLADCTDVQSITQALQKMYYQWKEGTLESNYNCKKLKELFCEDTIIAEYDKLLTQITEHV